MNTGYRIRSHTVAVAAPANVPPAFVLWQGRDKQWHCDGPHMVAAILLGNEELSAPACLRTSRRRTASGREYTLQYADFADDFDERHFEVEHWRYMPVAFLLLPEDCTEWESIIVPSHSVAFSKEAASAIVQQRNAKEQTKRHEHARAPVPAP